MEIKQKKIIVFGTVWFAMILFGTAAFFHFKASGTENMQEILTYTRMKNIFLIISAVILAALFIIQIIWHKTSDG